MEGTTSIKKLVDEIGLLQRQVDSLNRVEECCCVAGLTGSGKSALICYLCKGELMVNRRMGRFIITHNNDRLPVIGNRMESETKTLNLFTTPDSMVLYDPPGFASTEGGFQEILDSYSNAKMFKIGSKVRIVIVVDCHTVLAGRGGGFVEVARRLHQLFGRNFNQVINSCILVISKVGENMCSFEELIENVKQISEDNQKLGTSGVMLVKTLIQHKRIIGFPIPDRVDDNVVNNIKAQIRKVREYVVAQDPHICLSAQSKLLMKGLINQIDKNKNSILQLINLEMITVFKDNLNDKDVLEANLLKIRSAKAMLINRQLQSGIPGKIEEIQTLLSIRQERIEKIKEWMSQVIFCRTIYSNFTIPQDSSEILLIGLSTLEGDLELELSKLVAKERIRQINQQHRAAIHEQEVNYRAEVQSINRRAAEQVTQVRQRADQQNQSYMNQLRQRDERHMAEMTKLNSQLVQIANRPPTVITEGGGGCQLI